MARQQYQYCSFSGLGLANSSVVLKQYVKNMLKVENVVITLVTVQFSWATIDLWLIQ